MLPVLELTGSDSALSTAEDTAASRAIDMFSSNRDALESLIYSVSTQATDDFVQKVTFPRPSSTTETSIAYRIRDLNGEPVIEVKDVLDDFADVYGGRFSFEGGFYICPETNTDWEGVAEQYCHITLNAYLSDGTVVYDETSRAALLERYPDVTHFSEQSGLGAQVMIDWSRF